MSSSLRTSWRQVRLSDVCEIQLGKMLSPKAKTGIRYRNYLRNTNVQWGRFDLGDVAEMDFDEDEEQKFALRSGDLLVCEGGEPGRAAVWQGQINPCFYQKALHRLRPVGDDVDSSFVMYRLWLGATSGEFGESHSKTTIAHLPAVRLAALTIAIPTLREQQRIVGVLNESLAVAERVRKAAEVRQKAIEAMEMSVLRRVFWGMTPLSSAKPYAAAPSGWTWRLLADVAKLESGHTPSRLRADWWGGDIPWVSLTDIRELDGRVATETRERTNVEGIANSAARILPPGTVVLSRTASVGFVTIMGREMATSQDFVNWVCGPEMDPHFLAYALRGSRTYIRSLSSGAIHQTVYMPTVEAFTVCMPPIGEQKRVVVDLDRRMAGTQQLRDSATAELSAIEAVPAALLRRAFSGEL